MSSLVDFMRAMCAELETAVEGIELSSEAGDKTVAIYPQTIPVSVRKNRDRRAPGDDTPYPYVIVRLLNGATASPATAAHVDGVLVFGTKDDNSDDAWIDLLTLIERVRLHLEKTRFLGGAFIPFLEEPWRWEIPLEQGVNAMEGYLFFKYYVGRVFPEVDFDGREFHNNERKSDGGYSIGTNAGTD